MVINNERLIDQGFSAAPFLWQIAFADVPSVFDHRATSGPAFIVGIVMIESVMLAVSTFSYDDMAKWNSYMLAMPVSRKTAVREKYALAFLLSLIGIVLSIAAGIAAGALRGNIDLKEVAATVGGCFIAACLYVSVMIPMTYRFGAEKMRFLLLAVFSSCFLLCSADMCF